MQSITTKYLPPTNNLGSRIRASCERGAITIAYESGDSCYHAHALAAHALVERFVAEDAKRYGTPPDKNPWARPMQYIDLPNGYVFGWPEPASQFARRIPK